MHYAAATGQIAAAAVLVSRYNHLVTHRDSDSNTPLHLASFGDHSAIASILLDNGAAPTELNNFNSNPLHMAALGQAKGTMAVLLHASTNYYFHEEDDVVNAVDDAGHSPLHKAIIVDDTKCAKLLLDSGADVNLQEVKEVESPLHTAAKSGHNDMTQLLLDYGADATQVTPEGFTTLHLAAASGSFDTVKTLLDNGFTHDGTFEEDSSVSPATTLGLLSRRPSESRIQTPLEIACSIGATDIASLLIDAGAEVRPCYNVLR
jgi:ankyrin repeat protein